MMNFVEHHFVGTGTELPPYKAALYDYLVGANGVFIRSQRQGLSAILPVTVPVASSTTIRGLAPIEPAVQLAYPRVPAALTQYVLDEALAAHDGEGRPVESLFHLEWRGYWHLTIPEQRRTASNVIPLDDGATSSYASALIELHSHHDMRAFFSSIDDRDETGFRIYAVIGRIFTCPELLVRIGCEGVHLIVPATQIFDLPETIIDAAAPVQREEDYQSEEEPYPYEEDEELRL